MQTKHICRPMKRLLRKSVCAYILCFQSFFKLGSPSLPLSYCCSNTTLMSHSVVLGDKFLHYCEHTLHFIWTKRLIYNSGLVFVSFTLFYSI